MKTFATITVIGRDRTGVVARITSFLFEQKANIEALEEQVTRGQFSMTIQGSWRTRDLDESEMRLGLARLAEELHMEIKLRLTELRRKQRLALMVTRESGCPEAILRESAARRLKAEPRLMISNRPELAGLAKGFDLPFFCIPWQDRAAAELEVLRLLEEEQIDFVVLARFMKILSPNFVWRYKNKIINIHPSLLPSFPGPQAYRQAYEHGVKLIGVTAHFVSMQLDEGPIIAQGSFPVRPEMNLPEIVATGQRLEARVLVKAVKLFLNKRLDVYWGTVKQV